MASKAKDVYGIDIVEDSIIAARSNTELNGITNCHYICGDVKEKLDEIPEKPDVIVVEKGILLHPAQGGELRHFEEVFVHIIPPCRKKLGNLLTLGLPHSLSLV
jgi:tRNA G37 N-methylase Trm5